MDWSIFLVTLGALGFVFFLLKIVISKLLQRGSIKKSNIGGALVCLVFSGAAFFELSSRDWTIAECRDENGSLILENPKCQYS
jgi:hypothetical protein